MEGRSDFTKNFSEDKIIIDEKVYARGNIEQISKDFSTTIGTNPITGFKTVHLSGEHTMMGEIPGRHIFFELNHNKVVTLAFETQWIVPCMAAMTAAGWKAEHYKQGSIDFVDFNVSDKKKVTLVSGMVSFIWY